MYLSSTPSVFRSEIHFWLLGLVLISRQPGSFVTSNHHVAILAVGRKQTRNIRPATAGFSWVVHSPPPVAGSVQHGAVARFAPHCSSTYVRHALYASAYVFLYASSFMPC